MTRNTALACGAALVAALAGQAALAATGSTTSGSIRFTGRIVASGPFIASWTAVPGGSPRQSADGLTRIAILQPGGGANPATVRVQAADGRSLALRCAAAAPASSEACRIGAEAASGSSGNALAFAAPPATGPAPAAGRAALIVSYD